MSTELLSARELGERINAHLARFEADPELNAPREYKSPRGSRWLQPFFQAHAWGERKYVYVRYVAYQGISKFTREQAQEYLAWLDAGNVGTHRTAHIEDVDSVRNY